MKILICGNGNVTKKTNGLFLHTETARFLQECTDIGITVGYATIVLDEEKEKIRNLANAMVPRQVTVERFLSFSQMNLLAKLIYLPVLAIQIFTVVMKYDFCYCYYPGTLASIVIWMARLLHKKYALYVRGELSANCKVKRDILKSSFIYATGTTIVSSIVPEYSHCYEVAPMSSAFRKEQIAEPKTSFHQPLQGIFVGRVEEAKGVYELLNALTILKKNNVPVHLNFVGRYKSDFADCIRELELSDYVTLSGLAKDSADLDHYYKNADFFCLPTWTEGFPRVLYEAMSHALPCLTTMVGGIPSRMRDGENCIALKVRDVSSIVQAITKCVNDSDFMHKLSTKSMRTFRYWQDRFAGQTHAKQLYDALNVLKK